MADSSFDAVLIGGGSKGLVAAMYLTTYGGMSVGIFEDRVELGGGWCTEQSAAPGFNCNHCSQMHIDGLYHVPVYQDFPDWEEYGAKYAIWPVTAGVAFREDDSWIGVYPQRFDPNQEKTASLMGRFSQKDADTYISLWRSMKEYLIPALLEWCFTPAQPFGVPDAMDRLLANPEVDIDPSWLLMSPAQFFRDIFESKEAQVLFARSVLASGVSPELYGGGFGALVMMLLQILGNGSAIGGNHSVAHACHRVILENGGKIFTRSPVKKILIENGKATGIRLEDGTEVKAKNLVLSGVDPCQLCFELIGEEHLSSKIIRRIKNLERNLGTIAWFQWALKERPRYKAESFQPGVGEVAILHLGTKNPDDLINEAYLRRLHKFPDPENVNIQASDTSVIDPTFAPRGRATVCTEQWVVPAWSKTEAEWKEFERSHAEDVVRMWERYAPNMTWDNVIGYTPITPLWTSRQNKSFSPAGNMLVVDEIPNQLGRMRPIPELANGRMPISNLYATGAGWHPFGGANSMQGYNIYKVISEDFGLRKPWEEKGRPF